MSLLKFNINDCILPILISNQPLSSRGTGTLHWGAFMQRLGGANTEMASALQGDFYPCLSLRFAHGTDHGHGFDTDGGDAHQQVDDLFFVVGEAVGVEFFADGGVFGFFLFVLVQHPLDGAAVAEFVGPRLGRNAAQCGFPNRA